MLFHACSYASFAAVRSRSQSFPNAIRQSGIKRTRLSCKEGRTLLGANALRVSWEDRSRSAQFQQFGPACPCGAC
jgi:hypothetical protein